MIDTASAATASTTAKAALAETQVVAAAVASTAALIQRG